MAQSYASNSGTSHADSHCPGVCCCKSTSIHRRFLHPQRRCSLVSGAEEKKKKRGDYNAKKHSPKCSRRTELAARVGTVGMIGDSYASGLEGEGSNPGKAGQRSFGQCRWMDQKSERPTPTWA